jgi:hypothetical protein
MVSLLPCLKKLFTKKQTNQTREERRNRNTDKPTKLGG